MFIGRWTSYFETPWSLVKVEDELDFSIKISHSIVYLTSSLQVKTGLKLPGLLPVDVKQECVFKPGAYEECQR